MSRTVPTRGQQPDPAALPDDHVRGASQMVPGTGKLPRDAEPEIADGGKITTGGRCSAAHPEDPTPCAGPVVVTVLDATNAGADGCEHHGARLLASLDRGRVYSHRDAPAGTAIKVFKAAQHIRPFPWIEDATRTRPEQLSRAEARRGGETR